MWEQFVGRMVDCVTTTWADGTSIDPHEGETQLVVVDGDPIVDIWTSAMVTTPDPMHLRGAIHIIENLRPTMRREADVSARDLDRITSTELFDAVDRYPHVLARPGDDASLERLRHRYDEARPLLRTAV